MLPLTLSTFALIFLAEIGDKSQLVCMLLASRHRAWPVLLGAISAFAILNLLAVLVGSAIAGVIPTEWLRWGVAALFLGFGIRALLAREDDDGEEIEEMCCRGVFMTAFLMIFLAELGDKTQLAVAGLGATEAALPVYVGATLALAATSLLGVVGGRWLTRKISTQLLHRIGGVMFIGFALWAALG
jgi:putative Ca2+/H+ antiporter (TMEM165/GDT1 family)